MRDLLRSDAAVSLPAMVAVQAMITMSAFAIPVVAPVAADEIGIPALYVGGFTAVVYCTAMVTGLFTVTILARLGTIRTAQLLLLLVGAGTVCFTLATPLAALLGAIAIGAATGPMNPTGSHILARTSPPRWRAFVFSVKQCATPGGGMLAGVVVPPLLLAFDWKIALASVWLSALVVILLIQPARRRLDAKMPAPRPLTLGAVLQPLRLVVSRRELRAVAIMGFIYGGGQVALAAYLVVYVTSRFDTPIAVAGMLYAVFSGCGIPIRVVWGAMAERIVSSRTILLLTGMLMAVGFVLAAQFTAAWPVAAMVAVSALLGVSANGWVGLFFVEAVRLAPPDMESEASAGAQFFAYGG
ncbi:MAG: MFS transporter, partial [Alphaproteobacteria bacterium]|nr:MFS transporter [Alphaproteobacteria bacterium]